MTTARRQDEIVVTTLDLLKLIAVILMLADHVGLYVFENQWLRVAGRPVAVIFGFLIGLSHSTRVPPVWIALGIGLSLANRWMFPGETPHSLDILITLAVTRMILPFFERVHAVQPLLLVPLVGALALLTGPLNELLEYGSEVPILAILGVAVRLDRGRREQTAARHALALAALVAISLVAIEHFSFEGWEAAACVAVLAATVLTLSQFRMAPVSVPALVAPAIAWIGRKTLMIYAVHLFALMLAAWMLLPETVEATGEKDEAD